MKRNARIIWTFPATQLGQLLARLTGCRRRRDGRDSIWLATYDASASAPWLRWSRIFGMAAVTLGLVTVYVEAKPSARLVAHERVHVTQALSWGPLYLPVYLLGAVAGALRGAWYRRNPLEEEASTEK